MPNADSPGPHGGRRILSVLEDAGPSTIPEVAARLGSHPVTIERRCLELQRSGHVRQVTGGKLAVDGSGGGDRAPENENRRAVGD